MSAEGYLEWIRSHCIKIMRFRCPKCTRYVEMRAQGKNQHAIRQRRTNNYQIKYIIPVYICLRHLPSRLFGGWEGLFGHVSRVRCGGIFLLREIPVTSDSAADQDQN